MGEPDIEALAYEIASEEVQNWVWSDEWRGQFDDSNPAAWDAEINLRMDHARFKAEFYLRTAGVIE